MGKFEDLTGRKYSRLTVIKRAENKGKKTAWLCKCVCGKECVVATNHLKEGSITSCGCYMKERNSKLKKIHGMKNTRLYEIWSSMKKRCFNANSLCYKNYGARGIKVCEEWHKSFTAFHEWAINNGYAENLTLDRIDVNGNYEPNNCRWVTMKEQANNKRNNHLLTYNGETHTMTEWSEKCGIKTGTLWYRLKKGWTIEKALTTR